MPFTPPVDDARPLDAADSCRGSASLCVLASGSSGNASVLVLERAGLRRACLIDLGISPKRTWRMLAELGIEPHQVDDAIITHLDSDHFHDGWTRAMPAHVRVRLHAGHARHVSGSFHHARVLAFDGEFALQSGSRVRPLLLSHDADGVTAVRIDIAAECGGGSLGFATDLGHVTKGLIELFGGGGEGGAPGAVDVLAIESNYCPRMQASSGRPGFLIHRITGGHGHLSNHEAAEAIRAIEPREHVVLLHLSRDCNQVSLVAAMHEGSDYHLTIATHEQPTRLVPIRAGRDRRAAMEWSAGLEGREVREGVASGTDVEGVVRLERANGVSDGGDGMRNGRPTVVVSGSLFDAARMK